MALGPQPLQRTQMDAQEEVAIATAGDRLAAANMTEKLIEARERELQLCIAQNYSRVREVEHELAGLQLQLKLTSGPKRSALELFRKKIEAQNACVAAARERQAAAKKVFEAAEEALQLEERAKDQLCQELNLLVQQSAHAQIEKLEQLTQRLEYLNKGMSRQPDAPVPVLPQQSSPQLPAAHPAAQHEASSAPAALPLAHVSAGHQQPAAAEPPAQTPEALAQQQAASAATAQLAERQQRRQQRRQQLRQQQPQQQEAAARRQGAGPPPYKSLGASPAQALKEFQGFE